jgi:hypothetical protein
MGYIVLNFWLSKPHSGHMGHQVGLLNPVQVPHEKQPQIQHESQKILNFGQLCIEGSSKNDHFCIIMSHNVANEKPNFPDIRVFFTHFSQLFYFKGARTKTEWIPLI